MFAKYVDRHFPTAHEVLLVADGNLVTARELYNRYSLTVIDPDIRSKHKTRRYSKIIGKPFFAQMKINCDVIIGMHPDEATGEIIDYAIANKKPCAVVPCCMKGKYSETCKGKQRWVKHLKNILIQKGFSVEIHMLPIHGDNQVILARPRA